MVIKSWIVVDTLWQSVWRWKTLSAIYSRTFKWLNHITDQKCEVELVNSETEHREPIIVGFFTLQYAQLRELELYDIFVKKFNDTDKYGELEMDTDCLYLALSEESLEDVIVPDKRAAWDRLHSKDWADNFTENEPDNFFPRTCCNALRKHHKRKPGLFKDEFKCAKMLCLCSKTYCCYDKQANKYKFNSERHKKRTLQDSDDGGPMSKYRKVLEESVNVTSTNTGFRTIQHSVATYEQRKKRLFYFCPKRRVEEDGIHTKPLHLIQVLIRVSIACPIFYILIKFFKLKNNLFTSKHQAAHVLNYPQA